MYFLVLMLLLREANCVVYERLIHEYSSDDEIYNLPGLWPPPNFRQFSGYVSGSSPNIQLHYWFVESSGGNSSTPLVLWLNGGPGCSSLEGLLSENGPFSVENGPNLVYNQYSWNNVANVLYLEAPAGVGFSYSVDGNETTDDDFTSWNMYSALKNFLDKHPVYKGRDFYITGESYGGVYVPLLALRLLHDPLDIVLKGIAVGNGLTSYRLNDNSLLYFLNYHGLIDQADWRKLNDVCCPPDVCGRCMFSDNKSSACEYMVSSISESALKGLDVYNLYSECAGGVSKSSLTMHLTRDMTSGSPEEYFVHSDFRNQFRNNSYVRMQRNINALSDVKKTRLVLPCVDDGAIRSYLNLNVVRRALHVDNPNVVSWDVCSESVNRDYIRTYWDLKEQYLEIIQSKVPILIYNGDVDMACNFFGDEWFVDGLGLEVTQTLHSWYYIERDETKQVGGFKKVLYHTSSQTPLVYLTVRGAGHMVPTDKPIQAFHMIRSFLEGNLHV